MKYPVLAALVSTAVLFSVSHAAATVGDAAVVQMLGYEAETQRVVFLRSDGFEDTSPPQLYMLPLNGPRPRRAQHYRWVTTPGEFVHLEDEATRYEIAGEQVLYSALLARLVPLPRLSNREVTLTVVERRCRRCRDQVRLTGTHLTARTTSISGPTEHAHVVSLWRVPGRRHAVAVVSYLGIPDEGGYAYHEPVLLGYRPPQATRGRRDTHIRLEQSPDSMLRVTLVDSGVVTQEVPLGFETAECQPSAEESSDSLAMRCGAREVRIHQEQQIVRVEQDGQSIAELILPPRRRVVSFGYEQADGFGLPSRPLSLGICGSHGCRLVVQGRVALSLRFGGSFRCSDHTHGWMACIHTPNDDSSPQRGFWIRQNGRGMRHLALGIEVEERIDALNTDPENPSRVRMRVVGRQEDVVVDAPRR